MRRYFGALLATIAVAAVAGVFFFDSEPARGASFTVNSTFDNLDDNGVCTLREAMKAARENIDVNTGDCGPDPGHASNPDVITLADGVTYTLSAAGDTADTGDLNTGGGPMVITKAAGNGTTTIDANDIDRVITVTSDLTISNLILTNGTTSSFGGGINSAANLTLDNVRVTDNVSTGSGGGGGIHHGSGTLTIIDSTISGNSTTGGASAAGGGIRINNAGTHNITGTAIFSNSAMAVGTQLMVNGTGNITNVTNSTIALGLGSTDSFIISVQNGTTLNLLNATLQDDATSTMFQAIGTITARNTIFDNGAQGCAGGLGAQVTTLGNNIDAGDNCDLDIGMGDQVNTNAQLGALQLNPPGTSPTFALEPNSPAIDAGDDANCPATDQRGVDRPMGDGCDVGSYESPFTAPTPSPTLSPTPTPEPTSTETAAPTGTGGATPTGTGGVTPTGTGGPTPTGTGGPTPTPTATPSPTPLPSGVTPGPTQTATPTPTAGPSETAGPTGTPGAKLLQGDVQCDGDVDSVDALMQLRDVAGLETQQEDGCPTIGLAGAIFGDVDCDGDVDSVDALKVLRHVAALSVTQTEPCTDIGEPL